MLCVAAQLSILTGVRSSKLQQFAGPDPCKNRQLFVLLFSVVILGRMDCMYTLELFSCPPKNYIRHTVNVLKFRTQVAPQKGLDKQGRLRLKKQSDQGLPCLLF